MTRNVVTTELVADQPVVVVLHHDQKILVELQKCLADERVQVEYYSITELLQSSAIQQRLLNAYKIAWLTSTQEYIEFPQELTEVNQLLSPHEYKVTLLFSVITSFVEQVPGELPYAAQFLQLQQDSILFHNSFLPAATFLFGQDIISKDLPASFLELFSQDLHKGIVYALMTHVHPQSLESYMYRAVKYLLQPQRSSVLIRGNSVNGKNVANEIKQLYQSYHFSMVDVQEIVAHSQQTIPFSVKENFVTDDVTALVANYVQSLPTPAALPKNSLWRNWFGSLKPVVPEYGTEIETSNIAEHMQPEYEEIVTTPPPAPEPESEPVPPTPEPQPTELESTQDSSTAAKDDFNLNQEIQSIFSTTHVTQKKNQTKKIQEKKKVFTKKSKKRTAVFYGGLAFTGMGLGIVCLGVIFWFSLSAFKNSLRNYFVQQASGAEETSPEIGTLDTVTRLRSIVSLQADTYSLLLSLPALEDAKNLVVLGKELQTVVETSTEADTLAETLYLQIVGKDTGDAVTTAANLSNKALTAYESLSAFHDKLNIFAQTQESNELAPMIAEYKESLENRKAGVQALQHINPLMADLLGVNKKRTYAVVFQNNQELRPTGGFIEDVALLTFENGSLISSTVLSSQEVNDKVAGSPVPPHEIKQYLNEESWNFWDGNWNPHFPDTATQLTWFLEKSMSVAVDGVVTIDIDGMAHVLEATGPLDLPQYNEVLTHKNLLDRFEFHSEISLVESKEDYRKEVFQAFINKVTTLPAEKVSPFFVALQKNLDKQHMLIAFTAADELNTMKTLGWSGALLQPNCPSQLTSENCVVDTVAQVEANVGINKANYYLKRSIDESVTLTATQSAHSRSITFENTAQTDSWPKGPYKTFVRLYLPSSASIGSVVFDGVPLSANQVTNSTENNRKVVGFYVEVPVKQTRKVVVSYAVPYSQPGQSFSYTFFEQQQPGSGQTPFTLRVTPEGNLSPSLIAPQASVEGKTIVFTKQNLGHGFFGIKFN